MDFIDIILLSLVQGFTEWFPISSSAHIVIVQELFSITTPLYYIILLHSATLLATLLVFYKDIIRIIKAFLRRDFTSEHGKLGLLLIIASIPTAIIGFTFKPLFISSFSNFTIIGFGLLGTAALLFLTKYIQGKRIPNKTDAILIGCMQGLAIIPGLSRLGSTLSTGILLGLNKKHVITFSFLLTIPVILGATILEYTPGVITKEILLGMGVTTITGYITLKLAMLLVLKKKLHYFGYYCLFLAIIFFSR